MSGIIGGAGSRSGIIGETEIDYEEGEWTCTPKDASGTASSSTQTGKYTKIGRQVTVDCGKSNLSTSNLSGSSQLRFYGLPYPADAIAGGHGYVGTMAASWLGSMTDYNIVPIIPASQSYFILAYSWNGTYWEYGNCDKTVHNGSDYQISITYNTTS